MSLIPDSWRPRAKYARQDIPDAWWRWLRVLIPAAILLAAAGAYNAHRDTAAKARPRLCKRGVYYAQNTAHRVRW